MSLQRFFCSWPLSLGRERPRFSSFQFEDLQSTYLQDGTRIERFRFSALERSRSDRLQSSNLKLDPLHQAPGFPFSIREYKLQAKYVYAMDEVKFSLIGETIRRLDDVIAQAREVRERFIAALRRERESLYPERRYHQQTHEPERRRSGGISMTERV